jgi:hypothetical protein
MPGFPLVFGVDTFGELSSDDPVRVFQRYSALHALSGGVRRSSWARVEHGVVPAVRL